MSSLTSEHEVYYDHDSECCETCDEFIEDDSGEGLDEVLDAPSCPNL